MSFKELFEKVYQRHDLTSSESEKALLAIMDGEWEPPQISSFLTALHMKGEAVDEVVGFVTTMRSKCVSVLLDGIESMDTCGTGGDKKGSFNISTLVAFVLAGCGISIAKHGNRAASSNCGSADLLEALGIRFRLQPEEVAESMQRTGFAFLFAPDFHPATRAVAAIRRQIGMPTIFNLLGPMTNPARPSAQLIGVWDRRALPLLSAAIARLDRGKRAGLIHSEEGWDEATPCGPFHLHQPGEEPVVIHPEEWGFKRCDEQDLRGGSPAFNASIALSVLESEPGPARDAVLLNAMLGYRIYFKEATNEEALRAVIESLDSKAAKNVVHKLKEQFPL